MSLPGVLKAFKEHLSAKAKFSMIVGIVGGSLALEGVAVRLKFTDPISRASLWLFLIVAVGFTVDLLLSAIVAPFSAFRKNQLRNLRFDLLVGDISSDEWDILREFFVNGTCKQIVRTEDPSRIIALKKLESRNLISFKRTSGWMEAVRTSDVIITISSEFFDYLLSHPDSIFPPDRKPL